ncbi:MAG TPA: ribosome maturation factor RimM [Puia sp.]|nr:ribosome maturation factor RimM [Puia sp.]
MSQYRNIGRLVAVYGLKGELVLHHRLGKKTSLKGLEVLYLEDKKDEMLPYFLESSSIKNEEELYLKLEGVDNKEKAKRFVQKEVWLADNDFQKYAGKSAPISLVGYRVMHEDSDLGEILEVIEQPHQVLCRIELRQKEVLIPINEETLLKTDKKNKVISVSLPDGLLELYLGNK